MNGEGHQRDRERTNLPVEFGKINRWTERDTGEREKVEEKGQCRRESELNYTKLGFPFLTPQEIFFN